MTKNVSIVSLNYIKEHRQNPYSSNDRSNYSLLKVYFDANDLDQVSGHRKALLTKSEDRHYVINHLNKALFVSSPLGRILSYIKAFQDKYVELKN